MKIDNYSVAMNAQYYNLQLESTTAKLSSDDMLFEDTDSSEVQKVSLDSQGINNTNNELNRELSKGILKNIDNESRRLTGDRVEISSTYVEAQALNFSVAAKIQAQGKEIDLTLDVSLSRSFIQKTTVSTALNSALQDPLVISLDGAMPTLSSDKFSFDIDSNGTSEQISKLNSGNGFLAYDKNNNGKIDNGSELFGTKSGDGFADLSKYDDDENGWIDENDAIFDKLQIWMKNGNSDELVGLGEVGIGAIFLGNTTTPFSLKSETNELLGEIRKSSFVLFEDGKAGLISQVDLAVTDKTKDGLNILDSLQKNLNSMDIGKVYNTPNEQGDDNTNEKMHKIQGKIKSLESKLKNADDTEKPGLQARIGALYAQLMSMLESNI